MMTHDSLCHGRNEETGERMDGMQHAKERLLTRIMPELIQEAGSDQSVIFHTDVMFCLKQSCFLLSFSYLA